MPSHAAVPAAGAGRRPGRTPLAALLLTALSCAGGAPRSPEVPSEPLPVRYAADTEFDVPGDASGSFDMSGVVVYGFTHNSPVQEDPQVTEKLVPDLAMRGWMAGWRDNQPAQSYTVDFLSACHARSILFMGGVDGSALFREDASSEREFHDWATRDARGQLVEHTEAGVPLYRGSLANPSFREHLLAKARMQIDLGVDGIHVDEPDGIYHGGKKWGFNGNEGYDDYWIADFNLYLIEKYPQLTAGDWIRTFGMRAGNVIDPALPYTDLVHNFNYRRYLQENGWSGDPRSPANPLAAEFGDVSGSRVGLGDATFVEKATRLYWKSMVLALRKYAREVHGKELMVTGNGIFPYVDYNSLGMFNYNTDDHGQEADYVPITADGHLDGARSLRPVFRQILDRSRASSGDVPLVVFIDWPTDFIDEYYRLSIPEKMDLWRIYVPEAYASGLRYAFHLKTADPRFPTATDSGVIDFMAGYAGFYKEHRGLYQGATPTDRTVGVSTGGIEATLHEQPAANRWLVHLVNHNYDQGIQPQAGVRVSFESPSPPVSVSLASPDQPPSALPFSHANGTTTIEVASLEYYDVLVIQW